jgi:hypothetical protein
MALVIFDPPGFLDDLTPPQKAGWHTFISDNMDRAAAGRTDHPNDAPRPQFFNSAKVEIGAGAATEDVKWTAFPRIIQVSSASDKQRWRRSDASRDVQDEYCEWSVTRDSTTNKITRIDFTCEGPEYWGFLARINPAKVLALYRQHVDPSVKHDDLFTPAGAYNSRNRWNNSTSHGAMHLIQVNNSLGAEIEIGGAGSIQRSRADGTPITDAQELIACGQYGAPERNSDPFIGARVNFHARNKADLTLANPVGIYFAGLDTIGWSTPDGTPAAGFWSYTRGTPDRPVRARLEVPAGKGYVLGDVKINPAAIEFGGQVADRIQMTIRAVATRSGSSTAVPVRGCVSSGTADAGDAMPMSVHEALAAAGLRRGRV